MVSAVFHSPLDAAGSLTAHRTVPPGKAGTAAPTVAKPAPPAKPARQPVDWREVWLKILPPLAGIACWWACGRC